MFFALAACLVVGHGCNIKEDRSECPCRLVLDLGNVGLRGQDSLELYLTSTSGLVWSARLDSAAVNEGLLIEVPRTSLKLMAWCGGNGMTGLNGMVIPLGTPCSQVYMYSAELETLGDVCRDTLVMRKNHCVLTVLFRKDDNSALSLSVRGNVCGYDAFGIPVEGEFLADVVRDSVVSVGCPQVTLPRQSGGELYLDVEDDTGDVKSFPLSEYMETAGYDWYAPDLPDMMVTIDYVQTSISLEIQGWDEEFFFDIVI